jgi:acyl-CoA thioester hydrolase
LDQQRPPRLDEVHRTSIQVRWGELDPYNHVNHAVYSSYLEHARIAALATADSGMDALTASGYQIVVTRSDVSFRASATAGDELVITTRVEKVKGARIVWQQRIERGDDLVVEAEIHAACLGATGRPARIPQNLRRALTSLA